ncbi:hypothetical protein XELAEV_18010924mg [Xenopus laevis]|uniref:Uncharacterized protein n=1 Tax=Xenopus laevis TaxID=8355 RepID=A0A974DVG5_XENLA|nr:hypothetical protein XELAEV_18010924mg [Xenopus laevis]
MIIIDEAFICFLYFGEQDSILLSGICSDTKLKDLIRSGIMKIYSIRPVMIRSWKNTNWSSLFRLQVYTCRHINIYVLNTRAMNIL